MKVTSSDDRGRRRRPLGTPSDNNTLVISTDGTRQTDPAPDTPIATGGTTVILPVPTP